LVVGTRDNISNYTTHLAPPPLDSGGTARLLDRGRPHREDLQLRHVAEACCGAW
jgi:hypothetical protein